MEESQLNKHSKRGILTLSLLSIQSQNLEFGVTFGDLSFMDSTQVSFGALIYGMQVLDLIEKQDTGGSNVNHKVTIRDCGPLDRREVTFSEP